MTDSEADVYIFLAKHGPLKSGEIAKLMKKDKAQVFRILKSLQTKNLVESTLEFPARFTAVAFETILDSTIKNKREEVTFIENAKKDLLSYLTNTRQAELDSSLDKFLVIEGNKRIYPKITQMMKDTKDQFSTIVSVSTLLQADQFGLFYAAFQNPLKSKIQFRFLTELSDKNLTTMKTLLKRTLKTGVNLKGRNPDLGLKLFPRMVIKDEEEALFFIKPTADMYAEQEVCLWTNCKPLVQAFIVVFEDLWHNSTDILARIVEVETGKQTPEIGIIKDTTAAYKKYIDTLHSANSEIIMMTSSIGLLASWKNTPLLKAQAERGVSTKIMAPITSENLHAAQELSKFCTVKHVSAGYLGTTIVDGKHLFQFKELPPEQENPKNMASLQSTFYTNDPEYVEKIKNMLDDIWESARIPSIVTLESILGLAGPMLAPLSKKARDYIKKVGNPYVIIDEKASETITEKDVLDKIINPEKYSVKDSSIVYDRMYATVGIAVIHPPDYFNLPDTMIMAYHIGNQSGLGEENAMKIYLWLETLKGYAYVPVAIVGYNPRAHDFWKSCYVGVPAGQNTHLVKKDEIEILVQDNTLFAGWTMPIPLFPPKYRLPPAGILIEGYGKVKTVAYSTVPPSGYKHAFEQNYFDAFVTFFHPSSKYSGPGTDGYFVRDLLCTTYLPETNAK